MPRRRAISSVCLRRISPNSRARVRRNSVCRRKSSMRDYQDVGGLKVARTSFTISSTSEVLPGTGIAADAFWDRLRRLVGEYSPQYRRAIADPRRSCRQKIDAYHVGHRGRPFDARRLRAILARDRLSRARARRIFPSRPRMSMTRSRWCPARNWSCRCRMRAMC